MPSMGGRPSGPSGDGGSLNKLTDHDSTTTEGQQQQTAQGLIRDTRQTVSQDIHQDLGIDSAHVRSTNLPDLQKTNSVTSELVILH